MKFSLS